MTFNGIALVAPARMPIWGGGGEGGEGGANLGEKF